MMDVEHREVIVVGAGPAAHLAPNGWLKRTSMFSSLNVEQSLAIQHNVANAFLIGEKWLVRSTESMITNG